MTNEQLELGIILRDRAIAQAAKRAAGEEPVWPDKALKALIDFARIMPEFTVETVVEAAKLRGIDTPEPRAWGSVARRAVLRGIIRFDRYAPSANPRAHRRPTAVWRSLVYRP